VEARDNELRNVKQQYAEDMTQLLEFIEQQKLQGVWKGEDQEEDE
jgi:hypothetical protein